MAVAITGCKCLPLSGLTADISVSQIFSSLFIPLAWLRIWIMFVYYVVLLFPDGIFLIHEKTHLVLFLNSCTKCLKGKNKQKKLWNEKEKKKSLFALHTSSSRDSPNRFFKMRAPEFFFWSWSWQFLLKLHFPAVLRCVVLCLVFFWILFFLYIYIHSQE